jgi:hypothetical protein
MRREIPSMGNFVADNELCRRRADLTRVPPWRICLPDAASLRKIYVFSLLNALNCISSTPGIEHVD